MSIDLNRELAALFYAHDTVHLPGIGGFVLQDTSAEVDPVQGKIEAPSRQVVFNPNLVIDDSLLLTRLREEHQLSQAAAEQQIRAFVDQIKQTLDQGELWNFPGIGRLYRNYNGELQFLADGRNFSTDTFGLAPVELQTVTRSERLEPNGPVAVPHTATAAPQFTRSPASASPYWLVWLREHLLYVIGITAIIFLLGMWLLSRNTTPDPSLEAPDPIPRDRLNVPPSNRPPESPTAPDEAIQEDRPPAATEQPPGDQPSSPPRYALIAVGLFGNEANVQKMIRRIEQAGLEPVTVREDQLTRVGVQVRYRNADELTTVLRRVQSRIEDGAFILEKDGQRLAPE